jgi:hypothetical protein
MQSFWTFWILLATTPGTGKRASMAIVPTIALQPRMLYKNTMQRAI